LGLTYIHEAQITKPLYVRKVVAARGVETEEYSEVAGKFGGPCRGRTYGPLIKSPAEDLPENTQQNESVAIKGNS